RGLGGEQVAVSVARHRLRLTGSCLRQALVQTRDCLPNLNRPPLVCGCFGDRGAWAPMISTNFMIAATTGDFGSSRINGMPRLIDSGTSLDDGIDTSIRVPSVFSTSCTRRPTL